MTLTSLRTPDELSSPQLSSVSGGTAPRINYESYVESAAAGLPALENAQYARDIQDEELRLNREARESAARDANIALGIQGATTATKLATNPTLQKYGSKVWSALTPKPPMIDKTLVAPETGLTRLADAGSGVMDTTGAPSWMPVSKPLEALAPGLDTVLPQGHSAVSGGNWLSSGMDKFGGQSTLGKVGTVAGSTVGAFSVGNQVASGSTPGNLRSLIPTLGKKESEITSGALGGALTGFVASGFNPLGAAVGAIFGGVGSKNKAPCIIWTATCGEGSYELEICREFRDKYMDRHSLMAYYSIADVLVPIIESNPEVKALVKEWLVEPLTRVGAFKLGHAAEHPSARDCAITNAFLGLLRDVGKGMTHYTRSSGEEV